MDLIVRVAIIESRKIVRLGSRATINWQVYEGTYICGRGSKPIAVRFMKGCVSGRSPAGVILVNRFPYLGIG